MMQEAEAEPWMRPLQNQSPMVLHFTTAPALWIPQYLRQGVGLRIHDTRTVVYIVLRREGRIMKHVEDSLRAFAKSVSTNTVMEWVGE